MATRRNGLIQAFRNFNFKKFSPDFDFVRSPLIMMAVYDMVTSVHTAMEAFYYANHFDRPLLGRAETEAHLIKREMRAYGIFYSWAILAVVSFMMSIMLIISTVKVKIRLLLVWSCWEAVYLVASATLSVLGFQHVGVDNSFQVIYLVVPRIFGLYGIFVVLMHYYSIRIKGHCSKPKLLGSEKDKENGRQSRKAWERQKGDKVTKF